MGVFSVARVLRSPGRHHKPGKVPCLPPPQLPRGPVRVAFSVAGQWQQAKCVEHGSGTEFRRSSPICHVFKTDPLIVDRFTLV